MGKQVRFFMTYEDEKDFLESVRELGPLSVIFNTFRDESAMEVQSLQPVGISIYDDNLSLVNPTIVGAVKYEFYPSQAYYCVDLTESEVVQFNRCEPFKTWLNEGRLWFDEKSSQGKKSAAFVKWANSLLRWIRSHSITRRTPAGSISSLRRRSNFRKLESYNSAHQLSLHFR